MYELFTGLFALAMGVLIVVALLAAFRSLMLWYWNLDKMEASQRRLVELSEKQLAVQEDLVAAIEANTALLRRINGIPLPVPPVERQAPPPPVMIGFPQRR